MPPINRRLGKLWIRDSANKMKVPSIDRLDNNKDYEFTNCRFLELRINCGKDKNKSVIQYGLDGKEINCWESIKVAATKSKVHHSGISQVCTKKRKTAGGYVWRYKDENS